MKQAAAKFRGEKRAPSARPDGLMPATKGMGRWLLAALLGASLLAAFVVWRDLDRLDEELAVESLRRLEAVEAAWFFRRSLLDGQLLADRVASGGREAADLAAWLRGAEGQFHAFAASAASPARVPAALDNEADAAQQRELEALASDVATRYRTLRAAASEASTREKARGLDPLFEAVRPPLRRLFSQHINRQAELLARGRDFAIQARVTMGLVALVALLLGLLLFIAYRRRRALEKRANATFRIAASAVEGAIFDWDVRDGVVSWSEGVRRVFAFPDAPLSTTPAWCFGRIHPEDRKRFRQEMERAALATGDLDLECRVVAGDGSVRIVSGRGRAERSASGRVERVAGSVVDVTRRRQAEQELRERERFTRRVAETVPYLLYVYDLEAKRTIYINRSLPEILGYGQVPDRGAKFFFDSLHPDDRAAMAENNGRWDAAADEDILEIEYRLRGADGEWRWFLGRDSIFARGGGGAPTQIVGTAQDVTVRKRAEMELRQAQERLELALWGGDLGLWDWNIATGDIAYNERWAAMIGYSLEELSPRVETWESMVHPEDYPAARALLEEHFAGKSDVYQCEYRMRSKSGEWRWIMDRGKVVERDAAGAPARAAGIHLDTTERKKAERALRESEARLQTAIESLPFDFWVTDAAGRYAMQNSFSIACWGDRRGRLPEELADLPAELTREWTEHGERALAGEIVHEEAAYARPGQAMRHFDKIVAPVRDGDRVLGSLGVAIDVTKRKIAEEELRRREVLLQAAASSAERLLRSPDWRSELDSIFAEIGAAARASRVYFFDVEPPEGSEGERVCSQRCEWVAAGVKAEIDNPALQRLPLRASGFGRWADVLGAGGILSGPVAEFPAAERAMLEPQGIKSLLIAPVSFGGAWRGFIGYDDCDRDRAWSAAETGILKAVAETLGSAMRRERDEAALRESEERYRHLVDAAPVGIFVHVDGKFVFANQEAARILGAESSSRVLGMTPMEIIHPDYRGMVAERLRRLAAMESTAPLSEQKLLRFDGGVADVEVTCIPMTYEGRPAVQALVHDIASRKRGESARQLMLRVAQAASETDNLPQLLRSIHRSLAEAIFISELHVALLDPSSGRLDYSRVNPSTPVDQPTPSPDETQPSPPASRRLAAMAVEEGRALLMDADGGDLAQPYAPGSRAASLARAGGPLWMSVPLVTGTRVIGAVALLGREERDIELVEFVSGQIARAVERQAARESLRAVAQGTAGVTGDDFFFSLVEHLARALRVRYALVSELETPDSPRARSLAFWAGGSLEPNFDYELAGTPCEVALRRSSAVYADGVAEAFPEDAFLRERGVESYICAALRNSVGATVGFLDVMHDKPLRDTGYAESVLRIFAARAAAEIERQRAEERVAHQALHDALTGLPNRALFIDRVHGASARCERRGESMGVLFIDLDRFKWVNDSYGHAAGDELIAQAAQRLLASARNEDTVARLGGDEFTMLLDRIDTAMDATKVADRVLESLRRPFFVHGREVRLSASVGVALGMAGEPRSADLLRDADSAMYRAKAKGKNRYEIFDAALHERLRDKMRLEHDLRHAVARGEIEVAYQPRVNLTTGRVEGAEALARWRHPQRGLLLPESFIPLAEETGLVLEIDRRVLAQACLRMKVWRAEFERDVPLTLSANLSARQFLHNEALVEEIRDALADSELEPAALRVEITESVAMDDAEATVQTLHRLRALGVGLEIDDFGIGYSSLRYLRRFPVDALKIDRSFISGLELGENENAAIVRTIVALARNLGLRLIAEGIETTAQMEFLRGLGCEHGQGFLFAKPLAEEEMRDLLERDPRW
jgi:diguanylate cyclase (GGDEF)-like protein/PAS domain S-box-containing protein